MVAEVDAEARVTCTACAAYRPEAHRCSRWRAAGLMTAEVGPDLAELPQRCPGFVPLKATVPAAQGVTA